MSYPAGDRVPLWRFRNLGRCPGVRHFVSTRAGGVSSGPYGSLNLGYATGDMPANVFENRTRLAQTLGISLDAMTLCRQVHGSNVVIVTGDALGAGARAPLPDGDALETDLPSVMLTILVADCVPVLLYDPVHRAVAVAHAGWRGTVAQVTGATIDAMERAFGANPADLLAGIGPSIGPCCYQVGLDAIERIRASLPDSATVLLPDPSPEHARFDLWRANQDQLLARGVPPANIELARVCTKCRHDRFFSERYRRGSGRFAAGIMLVDAPATL
jgi:polyphenol oxidase